MQNTPSPSTPPPESPFNEEDILHSLNQELTLTQSAYPDFDMETQLQNPKFLDLLYKGMDIKSSYELINAESLQQQAIAKALKEAKVMWMNELKAANQRPVEEATQANNKTSPKNPALMSRSEREDIAQRAARGETITFKENL